LKCDIIHAIANPIFVGFPYIRRKCILSLHGVPLDSYSHFVAGKFLSNKVDIVHSVSEYTARVVKKIYDVKSKVIYNGVDTEFFHPIEHYNERPKVLYVGRLISWKRPLLVAKLAKEFPEADFIIHGKAPRYGISVASELREIAKNMPNLKLQEKFISESELRRLYQTSDIFLFPSTDWCPLVVLEAMACGLPVLLHRIGGQAEKITHGKEAFLSYSYEEFRKHLHYLLEDENTRRRMGRNARKLALKLDWKNIAKQYELLYEELFQ